MTATVITPMLGGSAIELAGTWRKRLLPVGEINYKGRVLKFTAKYLQGLAQAFADGAYDQVPLQLAGADNAHTNAIERFAGRITGADVQPDGLWVTVEATACGDAILQENPMLGVSARIVEDYDRADGKFYPAAIQHVLATHDPRITGLGGWQAVEASNDGGTLIDLSNCTWIGEPVLEFSAYLTDATPQEIAVMDQIMAEMAEEAGDIGISLDEWCEIVADGDELSNAMTAAIELAGTGDAGYGSDEDRSTVDGMTCGACSALNNFDSKYCSQCGVPLAPEDKRGLSGWVTTGDPAVAGLQGQALRTLSNLDEAIELSQQRSFSRERDRQRQQFSRDAFPGSSETRLADALQRIQTGTYLPGREFAFSTTPGQREITLSQLRDSQGRWSMAEVDDGAITYGIPVGALDPMGRCGARFHEASCSSLGEITDLDDYKDELRLVAMLPANQDSDATYTDFIEAGSGQRLSHDGYSMFESGGPRRELISIGRRQIHGADPDADSPGAGGFSAGTATRNAVIAARQAMGMERPHTSREARIADAALRMPNAPRHPDYSPQQRTARKSGQLRVVEDTEALSGSLPVYSHA